VTTKQLNVLGIRDNLTKSDTNLTQEGRERSFGITTISNLSTFHTHRKEGSFDERLK